MPARHTRHRWRWLRWPSAAAVVVLTAATAAAVAPATPAQAARKYVYITFDDGPSPTYTPQILNILRDYGVRATFFEIGKSVAAWPALTRRAHRRGMSIQNHTWAHKDMRYLPWASFKFQVRNTDRAISAETGYTPRCLRPPGGAVNSTVYSRAARLGKTIKLWTVDPRDWSRPGTAAIVERVLDHVRSGSVVLLHDGGGNRSQTVAALPAILRTLRARGYVFYRMWC